MQCRNCGTEIADKAIVCYRCGQATTDPARRPARLRPRRSPTAAIVAMALLVVLAVYLERASRTAANPDLLQLAAGLLGGAAAAVLLFGILRRQR